MLHFSYSGNSCPKVATTKNPMWPNDNRETAMLMLLQRIETNCCSLCPGYYTVNIDILFSENTFLVFGDEHCIDIAVI